LSYSGCRPPIFIGRAMAKDNIAGGIIASPMLIRIAKPDDVPAVLPMVQRICAWHESMDPARYAFVPSPAQHYENWLRRRAADPHSVFLVAERVAAAEPSRLTGFLVGTVDDEIGIYRIRQYGFIHDVWVEPEYRHEGTGRRMVMAALERFSQIGVCQVRLDTLVSNEPAQRLFRSCGFRAATVQMLIELGSVPSADEVGR